MRIYLDNCAYNRPYDKMTSEEIFKSLQEYSQTHEFDGKKAVII